MRRDSFNVSNGEFVGLLFDTFYDRRNGINFGINPIGGRVDAQMTDERAFNMDWNPIWELQTGRFEGGWTFEAAFPFKSLRYQTLSSGCRASRRACTCSACHSASGLPRVAIRNSVREAVIYRFLIILRTPGKCRRLTSRVSSISRKKTWWPSFSDCIPANLARLTSALRWIR